MAKDTRQRANVLQGTLDMLILRTLILGPAHGHEYGEQPDEQHDDMPRSPFGENERPVQENREDE